MALESWNLPHGSGRTAHPPAKETKCSRAAQKTFERDSRDSTRAQDRAFTSGIASKWLRRAAHSVKTAMETEGQRATVGTGHKATANPPGRERG